MLAQLERVMDKQFQTIDGLDSKAGQLFGIATLVTALMGVAQVSFFQSEKAISSFPCWFVAGGFLLLMFLYLLTIVCLIRAFRIEAYYLPIKIDRDHIDDTYLSLSKNAAQQQLLANHIECSQMNWAIIEDKARWIKWGLYLLGLDIFLLIILIATGTVLVPS